MPIRRALAVLCLVSVVTACSKREKPAAETATASTTTASTSSAPTAAASAPAAAQETNLAAIGAGAVVVQKAQEDSEGYGTFRLLDESEIGWSTPDGVVSPQTMVIALPGKCELSRVEFDTEGLKPGRAAKDIVVEVSDTSSTAGFSKIAQLSLEEGKNHQSFPASATVAGRWVKLTIQNNHGVKDYIELPEFRAFGKVLALVAPVNVTGNFTSNEGDMQLRQEGAAVAGCYGTNGGKINGGIEGRAMKFTWQNASGDTGTGVVTFSDDGKEFFGLFWDTGATGGGSIWSGSRATGTIAGCGLTSNSGQEQMAKDLETSGRTRVYGILFDTDSATIKPESKATLDDITAVLKSHADWKMTIEGHTDSTGGDAHNQQLSNQRAESVKSYLVNAGIDAGRLTTSGLGATKPVAPNDTEIGRAQNRRVELVK